ncbi:NlpC/P60 family protein [Oceanobacillus halophilus]|uniref:Peptidase n=1 Tax=Oceanobacillus halophilus TaxID=930130 RepID=A0A495A7Y4_9BACI|nr:C40 family peptidase [Oceanobacillus halophilus]RKQ35505.1 peptidase [Oceanobacillus halophilus]
MKKTVIALSAVAVIGFTGPMFVDSIHAQTIEEVQAEREEIKDKLSDAENKIADVLIEINDLEKEIEKTNNALKENQKMMDQTEADIAATEEEINALESEIAELEAAIEKRYDILKERVQSYQQNGGNVSYLEVIFGSKSFGDFISRVTAVSKITESDQNLIKSQEADKQLVEEKQANLEEELEELTAMKVELEGMVATIKEQKAQTEEKMGSLDDKKQRLVTMKEDLQIEDSQLASLEQSLKAPAVVPANETQVASSSSNTASKSSDGGSLTTLSKSSGSGNIQTAVNAGFNHLGTPYVWAGKSPSGFDCSGFVSWAFSQAGISIPSSTAGLQSTGTKVSYSNAQPGDLVFFNTYKTNGHVGIYLGGGKFIGAQNSTGLAVANMSSGYWKDHFAGHVRRVR